MTKILKILLFSFFVFSCSYEPIFSKKKYDFQFTNISYNEDSIINEIVKKSLIERSKGNNKYEIFLASEKDKEIVSKNEKGDPTIFNMKIKFNYIVKKDGIKVLSNTIIKESTYNNINDKFELLKYEENIQKTLSENISSEILISMTSI
tara:strand:+ start:844 stop:1290 length:447 start_codon:yes stop_codon:yes gene_type:complete